MDYWLKLIISLVFLCLGFPIGFYLKKITRDEIKQGQKWFKLIISVGFIGSLISLILRNDVLLFSFLFIVIVTSMSLKKNR